MSNTQSRAGILRMDAAENFLGVHYQYYPATPDLNMSGRVEDAEQGTPSQIDALNIVAFNENGWVAIHDLLEDLPGFDSAKLIAYLKEREDRRDEMKEIFDK